MVKIVHIGHGQFMVMVDGFKVGVVNQSSKYDWSWNPLPGVRSDLQYHCTSPVEKLGGLIQRDLDLLNYAGGEVNFEPWTYECPACQRQYISRMPPVYLICNDHLCKYIKLVKTVPPKIEVLEGTKIIYESSGVVSRDIRFAVWSCMKEQNFTLASLSGPVGIETQLLHDFFKVDYENKDSLMEKLCKFFSLNGADYT